MEGRGQGLFGEPLEVTWMIVGYLDLGSVASLLRCAKRLSGLIPADSWWTKKAAFDAAVTVGDFGPIFRGNMRDVVGLAVVRADDSVVRFHDLVFKVAMEEVIEDQFDTYTMEFSNPGTICGFFRGPIEKPHAWWRMRIGKNEKGRERFLVCRVVDWRRHGMGHGITSEANHVLELMEYRGYIRKTYWTAEPVASLRKVREYRVMSRLYGQKVVYDCIW